MDRRNQILEVALKEFSLKGYKETSLNDIAQQLDMTKPALYYHFPNKKSLFISVIELFFKKVEQNTIAYRSDSTSAKEQIRDILKKYFELKFFEIIKNDEKGEYYNHYYFIFDALRHVPETMDLYFQCIEKLSMKIENIIHKGISDGELQSDMDVKAFVYELGIFIEGLAVVANMDQLVLPSDMLDRMFELIWKGVT